MASDGILATALGSMCMNLVCKFPGAETTRGFPIGHGITAFVFFCGLDSYCCIAREEGGLVLRTGPGTKRKGEREEGGEGEDEDEEKPRQRRGRRAD
jgi:hypothetical protein